MEAVIAELQLTTNTPLREVLARLVLHGQVHLQHVAGRRKWPTRAKPAGPVSPPRRAAVTCEYFATATVLVLRRLEIPARYATGFSVHEPSGDGYVVRYSDAHARTLSGIPSAKSGRTSTPRPRRGSKRNRATSPMRWLGDAGRA